MSQSNNPQSGPVKRYEVLKNSTFTDHHLEIRHNGTPHLWANVDLGFLQDTMLTMHIENPQGPMVAAARFPKMSSEIDLTVGDPRQASDEHYVPCGQDSMFKGSWSFQGVGSARMYQWRRTHRKELGSSHLSMSDFKLVDPEADNKILMVYIKDSFSGMSGDMGHIDFYVQLEADLELQAITSILAIEKKLRDRRRSNNNVQGTASASAANTMN